MPVGKTDVVSFGADLSSKDYSRNRVSTTKEDIEWVRDQIYVNGLHMTDNVLRKGINPRSRAQQLQDLIR